MVLCRSGTLFAFVVCCLCTYNNFLAFLFEKNLIRRNSFLAGWKNDTISSDLMPKFLISRGVRSTQIINLFTLAILSSQIRLQEVFPNNLITVPLTAIDGAYYANYTVGGDVFRGIVDTGSPFLIVPSVCTKLWGCRTLANSARVRDTTYTHTVEVYGGQDYDVDWKCGDLELGNLKSKTVVFASVGSDILLPPGGVFIGLVKYKEYDIRPTLLGQLDFSSLRFDTISETLSLSKVSLLSRTRSSTVIALVDLRPFGDPVFHYAVKLKRLELNGKPIGASVKSNCTIYAIFDTGTTGCVLSDDLMNDWDTPNPVRSVKVVAEAETGDEIFFEQRATRKEIFVVTAGKIEWFKSSQSPTLGGIVTVGEDNEKVSKLDNSVQVVILGAIFMHNKVLTIDIDDGRLQLL